jgi:D-3-phosphoglycerate dehydrogenase
VLAAGDRFILPALFRERVEAAAGGLVDAVAELELPWPDEPFWSVGGVDEASGEEESLIEHLRGREAIVTQLAPLSRRVLDACPELRFIGVSRGGPTNVDLAAATERGIAVCNVPGRNGIATAEMTLGLLLAVLRRIPMTQRTLEQGRWEGGFYRHDRVGFEVSDATIGLIGAGAVGGHVARILDAMGAHVIVHDPFLPGGVLDGVVERVASVDEVFVRADIVSVHARLTEETAGLVSARRLALMRPGSYLVNAARGGLVDYDAVTDAVVSGRLGGVAVDVFPSEPADFSHPLFAAARAGHNIVMTPHIAGASTQTAYRAAEGVAQELGRFLRGDALQHELTGSVR